MIFSVGDIELMRLLWWCGNASPEALSGAFDEDEVRNLMSAGLIRKHKGSGSLSLTEKGRRSLLPADCPERAPLSYRRNLIERRMRVADLIMTAYRARMGLFTETAQAMRENGAVFLPSLSRGRERNVWGSSRIAALLRMGNCCCGAYIVYPGAGKVNLEDEEKTLSACASQSKSERMAFLLAGDAGLLTELERTDTPSEGRLISYGEAWQRTALPVHLLTCDDTGALQLRIMSQPDYRKRLAQAGLGKSYVPPPAELPHCDGLLRGVPFVIAADMDLRRLDAALEEAQRAGFPEVAAAALKGQVRGALRERYQGRVKLLTITKETLTAAFGDNLPLYRAEDSAFLTKEGNTIHVPPIQTRRKAGGSC